MGLDRAAQPDLITVRRKKGVSLRDISVATKIGVNYLEAIEAGEFAKLPGGIYSTSYIRQYAQAIDYNESELLERYYDVAGPPLEAPAPGGAPGRKSFSEILRPVRRVSS